MVPTVLDDDDAVAFTATFLVAYTTVLADLGGAEDDLGDPGIPAAVIHRPPSALGGAAGADVLPAVDRGNFRRRHRCTVVDVTVVGDPDQVVAVLGDRLSRDVFDVDSGLRTTVVDDPPVAFAVASVGTDAIANVRSGDLLAGEVVDVGVGIQVDDPLLWGRRGLGSCSRLGGSLGRGGSPG